MSESADFYSSWLGFNAFGLGSIRRIAEVPTTILPTDLSNCSIWLDANDPTTLTDNSANMVLIWNNKGLAGGSALANDGSVYDNTHTMNGLNVLNFTPYSDLLFNWTQTVNPITCFVVMKPITDLSSAALPYINFFDALSTFYNFGTSMYYDSGLASFGYGCGANNLGIYVMGYNATNPTNIPLSIAIRNDISANNFLTLNNTPTTLSYSDTANYNLSNFNYYMGSSVHGTEFDFAEFIIYERALSDEEIALVNAYLTAKWGIYTL